MFNKFAMLATLTVVLLGGEIATAQFGGLQVRVGGYGNGLSVGGFGYGNGFNNGYGNGYGNFYSGGNGYGYGNNYGSVYQSSYGNYSQPRAIYMGGGVNNGYGYTSYPTVNYSYGSPRYYNNSMRRFGPRRFH